MSVLKIIKEFSSFFTSMSKVLSSNQYGSITTRITVNQLRKQIKIEKESQFLREMKDKEIPLQKNSTIDYKTSEIKTKIEISKEDHTAEEV